MWKPNTVRAVAATEWYISRVYEDDQRKCRRFCDDFFPGHEEKLLAIAVKTTPGR